MGAPQIVLCANNIYNSDNMARVITHELIHVYDNCRAQVDFLNIKHLACTEVQPNPVKRNGVENLIGLPRFEPLH